MGYVKRENRFKVEAKKNHRKSWVLHELILYSLTALACSLFCYHPYWFPFICSFIQQLPYLWSCLFTPKCLFIVANIIIVFLLGESAFMGSNSSSNPASQYYEEYVARSSRRGRSASSSATAAAAASVSISSSLHQERKSDEMGLMSTTDDHQVIEMVMKEEDKEVDEEEEEAGLGADDLNKRVEEFIARVNKQRLVEARSLVCCQS